MVPRRTDIPFPRQPFAPGGVRPALPVLAPDQAWDYAIDLFDARFYWEAHEVLEPLWRAAAEGSVERIAIKALIQIAAARYKAAHGQHVAARRIAARAAAALAPLDGQRCRDLDLGELQQRARAIARGDAD